MEEKDKPNCKNHIVPDYLCDLNQVATDLADMPYDKLSEFFNCFMLKIAKDADNDYDDERYKLAMLLTHAEIYSEKLRDEFREIWKLCEPYMKKENQ